MKIIQKYRSERKYCEAEPELVYLKERLASILPYDSNADENGKYEINTLYFDDYKDTCAKLNVSGEGKRFKYRIRYYGKNSGQLWLEKKEKINSYCHKRKCVLLLEELADTVFEAEKMNGILAEFQNFMTEPLRKHNKRFLGDDSLINFYEEMEKLRIFFEERKAYLIPVLDKYR
ncbi:MAG: VTC domain-containing protein [Lachnospiraceae bacterium]|nr:VTC domain-containing protein [Lachnospiraceae bacterium]